MLDLFAEDTAKTQAVLRFRAIVEMLMERCELQEVEDSERCFSVNCMDTSFRPAVAA